MKRTMCGILAMAVVLTAPTAFAATAEADTAMIPIGTVRNDTLFVDRDAIVAAALQRNEMLAASGAMRDAAGADALSAWQGFTPQIRLGEFFLRSDDALSSFGFKLQNRSVTAADFNPVSLNNPGETNNFITRVQLLQPVFNGGMSLYGKQAANAVSRAAEFQHRRAAETVQYHAVQAFEGLTLARAYEGVMEAAVRSAEGHVNQARAMVAAEMATQADLLQAQVYLSDLQQRLIETRNMAAVAGENIKLLTATPTSLPLEPARMADAADGESDVAETLDPLAVMARSDLQAQRESATAADKMVGVAQGAVLPHINLSVQRDFYSLDNLFGDDARSWSLGVYATMGFGVQNVGEIKKAKAHSRAASHMVEFETRRAQVQATEAWLNARAAGQKVEVAREAVSAAREGLRIVSNQYAEGLATMVDLLDIQAAAIMAEGNLVQAVHDYRVGVANLEYAGAQAPETASAEADSATAGLPNES